MIIEIKSNHERETEQIGAQVGKMMSPGDVLALYGPLGSGKTAFVRGFARGAGYAGRVTSPTYSIVHEYAGRVPIFHFDLYRLDSPDALYEIGWEDYLERGGLCVVEWAERFPDAFPPNSYRIHLNATGESTRTIRIEGGPHADSGN